MRRDHLLSIQVLRGVAVLAVVVHHAVATIGERPVLVTSALSARLADIACLGACGVDLFFVISGFVMAHVASRGEGGALRFLIDRMTRILPMFWLMSALFIVWMLCTGTVFPTAAYLNTISVVPVFDAAQLPALYVGWTLAFELLFYGVAAAVIAAAVVRPAWWLMIVTALLATLGLSSRLHAIAPLLFNPIMGEFALGAAAWLVWHGGKCSLSPPALSLIGILMLSQTLVNPWTPGFSVHPVLVQSGATSVRRLMLWGLPCALMVAGVALAAPDEGWAIRGIGRLGDASYSIYLGHPLAFELLTFFLPRGHPIGRASLGAALLIGALVFGLTVHVLIERPLLRAIRRSRVKLKIGDRWRLPLLIRTP